MRELFIVCLVANSLSVFGFCQTSTNDNWFNNKSEEKEEPTNPKTEDSKVEDKFLKKKDEFDQLKEKVNDARKIMEKKREEFIKLVQQKAEESKREAEESRKKFEKRNQEFDEKRQARNKQSKEFFEKREKEFDQVREQLKEDLQNLKQKQEQKEVEKIKEVITSQCGVKQQNIYANASLDSPGQCFKCLSEDLSQDSQVFIFMSFSIPDSAWITLSQELERVGGSFVLRGLPNQSFQALASRILELKEQGVNAPIQLDPKSFLKFEVDQVPAIVAVEEQIFDKVLGHVSLEFALKKMSEEGETMIAKILYQSFKGQV